MLSRVVKCACCSLAVLVVLGAIHQGLAEETTQDLLDQAREKAAAKDYREAIRIYESILTTHPNHFDALSGKARALAWSGHFQAAELLYETLLEMDPGNEEVALGLADVKAWQAKYYEASKIVGNLLKKNPQNPEALIRQTRYSIWATQKTEEEGNRSSASGDIGNLLNQEETEQTISHKSYIYIGFSYLDINNNVNGKNAYLRALRKKNQSDSMYARVDYLERFNRSEGRAQLGGTKSVGDSWVFAGEISLAPSATIYPRVSGRLEAAYPAWARGVLYGGAAAAHYGDADLYSFSLATEYYPIGKLAWIARLTLTTTDFDKGGTSTNLGIFNKFIWFLNDDDQVFGYVGYGDEAYFAETLDKIGKIESTVVGLGTMRFLTDAFGLSPFAEVQFREGGTRYVQGGLEAVYRW